MHGVVDAGQSVSPCACGGLVRQPLSHFGHARRQKPALAAASSRALRQVTGVYLPAWRWRYHGRNQRERT
ncbi:hypothetical protein L499_A1561 [Bordetella holmesii CDC-H635-BH]|nr:hypothetical protein L499_A1561 [Bordetella holmesii CDC-H635-BH]